MFVCRLPSGRKRQNPAPDLIYDNSGSLNPPTFSEISGPKKEKNFLSHEILRRYTGGVDAAARCTFSLGTACFIEASGPVSEGGGAGGRKGGARDNRETEKSVGRMFNWSVAVKKAPPVQLSFNTTAEEEEKVTSEAEKNNIFYVYLYIYI